MKALAFHEKLQLSFLKIILKLFKNKRKTCVGDNAISLKNNYTCLESSSKTEDCENRMPTVQFHRNMLERLE